MAFVGPGLVGLALPELLDRIIIGPCQFPDIVSGRSFVYFKKLESQSLDKRSLYPISL